MRKFLVIALVVILLPACAPTPERLPAPRPVDAEMLANAESLASTGDYAAAAALYEKLAQTTTSPLREDLLFDAVRSLLAGGDPLAAETLLNATDVRGLPSSYDLRRRLLLAEADLAQSQPQRGLERLQLPLPADTGLELRIRYHRLRAEALAQTGRVRESAAELVGLDPWLKDEEQRLTNQVDILERLTRLPPADLELGPPSLVDEPPGWPALAIILKDPAQDYLLIEPQLEYWRERFPNHPALPGLAQAYIARMQSLIFRPARITVLLPESGRFQRVASALREGILAAYFSQPIDSRPQLVFLDSSDSTNAWPLYQSAVGSGAEMVLGPLDKDAVSQLIRAGELKVPVLALNQVPPELGYPTNLYQFSLSPEDEARQVADRARLDGYTKALVLTSDDEWGERLAQSFESRWQELGGLVVGRQTYDPNENDFTVPIQHLLKLDESIQRHRAMQQLLARNLEFEPRRRQDAQFLFLGARPQKAREIRPQLLFHHAVDLPVYATSHIYSGAESPRRDRDLDGILFPDIPWMVPGSEAELEARRRVDAALPGDDRYARYRAMGMDSYSLIGDLPRLRRHSGEYLMGYTGELYLDELNLVHRRLVWLRMHEGMPEIADAPATRSASTPLEPEYLTVEGGEDDRPVPPSPDIRESATPPSRP